MSKHISDTPIVEKYVLMCCYIDHLDIFDTPCCILLSYIVFRTDLTTVFNRNTNFLFQLVSGGDIPGEISGYTCVVNRYKICLTK